MWGVTPDNIYTAGLFFLNQTSRFISTIQSISLKMVPLPARPSEISEIGNLRFP